MKKLFPLKRSVTLTGTFKDSLWIMKIGTIALMHEPHSSSGTAFCLGKVGGAPFKDVIAPLNPISFSKWVQLEVSFSSSHPKGWAEAPFPEFSSLPPQCCAAPSPPLSPSFHEDLPTFFKDISQGVGPVKKEDNFLFLKSWICNLVRVLVGACTKTWVQALAPHKPSDERRGCPYLPGQLVVSMARDAVLEKENEKP